MLGIIGLLACAGTPEGVARELAAPVLEIHVRGDVGSVALIGTSEAAVSVRDEPGATSATALEGGDLWVDLAAASPGHRVEIRVPSGTAVDVAIGSGDVDLVDLDGRIAVTIDAGSIDGERLASDVFVARLRQGDVAASFGPELRAFDAHVEEGSVGVLASGGAWRLALADVDGEGAAEGVWAETSSRSIVAEAPRGRVYVEGR